MCVWFTEEGRCGTRVRTKGGTGLHGRWLNRVQSSLDHRRVVGVLLITELWDGLKTNGVRGHRCRFFDSETIHLS